MSAYAIAPRLLHPDPSPRAFAAIEATGSPRPASHVVGDVSLAGLALVIAAVAVVAAPVTVAAPIGIALATGLGAGALLAVRERARASIFRQRRSPRGIVAAPDEA